MPKDSAGLLLRITSTLNGFSSRNSEWSSFCVLDYVPILDPFAVNLAYK